MCSKLVVAFEEKITVGRKKSWFQHLPQFADSLNQNAKQNTLNSANQIFKTKRGPTKISRNKATFILYQFDAMLNNNRFQLSEPLG